MNQTAILHIVERLERLAGRLPSRIRNAVLSEVTPLKELFLQQRPPRFLFLGASKVPMQQIINALFASDAPEQTNIAVMPVHRWIDWDVSGHGRISILDARDAGGSAVAQVEEDLKRQLPDVVFLIDDGEVDLDETLRSFANLISFESQLVEAFGNARIVAVSVGARSRVAQVTEELNRTTAMRGRVLAAIQLNSQSAETRGLLSLLTQQLPNDAKIEMIRISRDRDAQHHVAQMLIKSTTAICAAIGAQPIPLADLPVLTSLQVVMVSGIMYISGRERSLRAATEFMTAVGANVGVGMLLREGARAILKFFPGWGNVVCGMVAGAGTYAIGRAASAFFIGGISLQDARMKYLTDRKKMARKLPWSSGSIEPGRRIE